MGKIPQHGPKGKNNMTQFAPTWRGRGICHVASKISGLFSVALGKLAYCLYIEPRICIKSSILSVPILHGCISGRSVLSPSVLNLGFECLTGMLPIFDIKE